MRDTVNGGRLASAVITFEPLADGEDGQVIEVPACEVSIVQEREEFYGSLSNPVFHLVPQRKRGGGETFLYRMKIIPGAITKGARALWSDKHPGLDVPALDTLDRTEIATRLRRKAKAVLDAARAA